MRRIDADRMAQALKANELSCVTSQQMVGNTVNEPAVSSNESHCNQAQFGDNDVTRDLKASDFKKDVHELRQPMNLDSSAVYEGEWLNGVPDGQGKSRYPDGIRYEGY